MTLRFSLFKMTEYNIRCWAFIFLVNPYMKLHLYIANQRCSNRPRPRNRNKDNGVEDEDEDDDEDGLIPFLDCESTKHIILPGFCTSRRLSYARHLRVRLSRQRRDAEPLITQQMKASGSPAG
jgi:hypothetical protein